MRDNLDKEKNLKQTKAIQFYKTKPTKPTDNLDPLKPNNIVVPPSPTPMMID